MSTPTPEEAHAQASREYQQNNPDYNPFHSTPGQEWDRGDWMDARIEQILNNK